ncbi:rod shape-determining protein MreD [Thiopseudomonas denitrificans]|uniref:Rod shape-determining protein MreD n=1 Tax=Thiopseudomonas denitrificans TaxID=1501432 RepID=A0A4R6U648_9GAMM|nr:rod shape-determining protein MreD [Thiopseudomonas denitrificans]TDQ38514.1 rod shape-determining protein MreD [Thiopseudomonas denitrificans]
MRHFSIVSALLFLTSLLLALILEVAPMPEAMRDWRPLWLALVVAYWALESPGGFRLLLAWLAGLMQDILYGSLLGLHALFLVVVAFAIHRLQQRLRIFPVWQQALILTLVFMAGQLMAFWLDVLTGSPKQFAQYMVPALISGLFWPWFYLAMHGVHRLLRR